MKQCEHRHRQLLRARHQRPCRRAAEQRDELPASHSITSSARARSSAELQAERLGGLEIDHELELGRLLPAGRTAWSLSGSYPHIPRRDDRYASDPVHTRSDHLPLPSPCKRTWPAAGARREINNPFSDTVDQWASENQQAGCVPLAACRSSVRPGRGSRFEYLKHEFAARSAAALASSRASLDYVVSGFNSTATRMLPGITARRSCSRLP